MSDQKKVLFLIPYPLHRAPSQRFRAELFLPHLQQQGITYRLESFLDAATWDILYSNASGIKKGWGVIKGFLKRFFIVLFRVDKPGIVQDLLLGRPGTFAYHRAFHALHRVGGQAIEGTGKVD